MKRLSMALVKRIIKILALPVKTLEPNYYGDFKDFLLTMNITKEEYLSNLKYYVFNKASITGAYLPGVIYLAKDACPYTALHELAHHLHYVQDPQNFWDGYPQNEDVADYIALTALSELGMLDKTVEESVCTERLIYFCNKKHRYFGYGMLVSEKNMEYADKAIDAIIRLVETDKSWGRDSKYLWITNPFEDRKPQGRCIFCKHKNDCKLLEYDLCGDFSDLCNGMCHKSCPKECDNHPETLAKYIPTGDEPICVDMNGDFVDCREPRAVDIDDDDLPF